MTQTLEIHAANRKHVTFYELYLTNDGVRETEPYVGSHSLTRLINQADHISHLLGEPTQPLTVIDYTAMSASVPLVEFYAGCNSEGKL